MKSKKTTLLILIIVASLIPEVRAITPQSQTVRITDTHDDAFITEAGIGIDSSLVTITDPNMDIRSYLVFRELEVNFWEPLKNATLRLHTSTNLPFDADSSITIYGIALSDLQLEGFLLPSTVLSLGFTSAHTDYNTSEFDRDMWHEIDVTSIVDELIRNPHWDGDGSAGTETGDAIGFHIVGAEGHDKRYFYDFKTGNGLEAQLIIHWNHEPQPPGEGWEFIEIHGENYSIWRYDELGLIELHYVNKATSMYHNSSTGVDGSVNWAPGGGFGFSSSGALETIERLDPWTFILADNGSTTVYYSDDEFSAGSIRAEECNAQFPILDNYAGNLGSIHLDQNDTQTLHVLWTTVTDWKNANYNVVYSNFTVLENGSLQWAPDFVNITDIASDQKDPDLYCEKDGTLHVVWYGHNGTAEEQIFYKRRDANGTWCPNVRVSEGDSVTSMEPDVVANEETGEALVAWTYFDAPNEIRWDIVFPNNTDGPDRVLASSRWLSMVNDRDNDVAHMAYVTPGSGGTPSVDYSYKDIDNSSAWAGAQDVSPNAEKHFYPSISVNEENDTLVIIWWNDWHPGTSYNQFQIGAAPVVQDPFIATALMRYVSTPDYHERNILWTVFGIFDENGTNVQNCTTLECSEDWIETFDPDPEDPNPGGTWDETGPFTRFKTRFYILSMGFGLLFGPLFYFAVRRPSGYEFVIGLFIMLVGISFMIAAGAV